MFDPEPWHPSRPGLYRPARLDPRGETGPTRGQAQGPTVRRTSHGLYLPGWVEQTTPQRIVEAAAQMQPGHVVTGWADLHWRGGRWFTGVDPAGVEVPVDILINTHDIRPRPGLHLCGEGLSTPFREELEGVALAEVRAAVGFLMRYAPSIRAAVRVLDMAAYDDLVSVEEMLTYIATWLSSWTGVPQARAAVALADENAWSPPEVDNRLVWVADAGRPVPLTNAPVFDLSGRHVATPDLLDADAGVAGEYDGMLHLERAVRARDVRREGELRALGLEVAVMTADDRYRPDAYVARLDDAYRRAARHRGPRLWTVDPPPWWTPTRTVEQRRALDPDQRRRFLRYRAS